MSASPASAHYSEILTVGDEILRGDVVNENAAYVGRGLAEVGVPARFGSVIPDEREVIMAAIEQALARAQVVVVTGGLGPTPDDVTRDAIADYFGLRLVEDATLLAHVQELSRQRGMVMPETSRNQALFPLGAHPIPNPHGTATGIHVIREGRHLFALPGVAVEMRQMMDEYVKPTVQAAFSDAQVRTRTLRLTGIGESHLLERLGDQGDLGSRVQVAYLPHHGLLDVRLTALSSDEHEAAAQIAFAEGFLRERVGEHVYATGSTSLAEVIGNILMNRHQKLATAESCTGGLVADMITDVAGASRWFERGWISYSNPSKSEELGVPADMLVEHGAVSEAVARAMAEGARARANSDWALACTGIAGPTGGSEEKPVGTVWIAVCTEHEVWARHLKFSGLRETIKLRTAHAALSFLHQHLLEARV
jgi:nicotinamide-nucleotide amidase